MTTLRLYRIALALSLLVNVGLVAMIWLYLHFEGTLAIVEEAVSFFN